MKKKIIKLSSLLLLPFALSACNFTYKYNIPRYPGDPPGEDDGEEIDKSKKYDIKIWCDQRIDELTTAQMGAFKDEHPDIDLTFRIDPVGEDSAASQMIEDVPSGADIFIFAQDQLNRLKTAVALAPINGNTLLDVQANNSAESVAAATLDGTCYAFPFTSDNGYFLMYDKSILNDEQVKDMATVMEVSSKADKKINFNVYASGFYTASYFMSTFTNSAGNLEHLCSNKWNINNRNKFDSYVDNYNSANGIIACKGIQQLKQYDIINKSDDPSKFGKSLSACVTGMWNYQDAKKALGDNLGCAPMPSFKVNDKEYHISSFSGFKLLGVKPQEDTDKVKLCKMIGKYLSGEACQMERFTTVEWGPTNNVASQLEAVINHPGLSALAEQNKYSSPQTACPSGWFDAVMSLATSIPKVGDDAAIKKCLDQYDANLKDLIEK